MGSKSTGSMQIVQTVYNLGKTILSLNLKFDIITNADLKGNYIHRSYGT